MPETPEQLAIEHVVRRHLTGRQVEQQPCPKVRIAADALEPIRLFVARPFAIDIGSQSGREFDNRQSWHEGEAKSRGMNAAPQITLGKFGQIAIVSPAADLVDDGAAVDDGGRDDMLARLIVSQSAQWLIEGIGRYSPHNRVGQIGAIIDCPHQRREMIRQPEIVMAEIGDDLAASGI